jgi:hypothetical protein
MSLDTSFFKEYGVLRPISHRTRRLKITIIHVGDKQVYRFGFYDFPKCLLCRIGSFWYGPTTSKRKKYLYFGHIQASKIDPSLWTSTSEITMTSKEWQTFRLTALRKYLNEIPLQT